MQNNDKKYFIPVDGTPIEVSEEIYRAYYQPIWNTRYHAQKNGECCCTKAQLWKCDGVCPGCPFYAAGKKVSIDTPIGGEEDELTLGDTLADDASSAESILKEVRTMNATTILCILLLSLYLVLAVFWLFRSIVDTIDDRKTKKRTAELDAERDARNAKWEAERQQLERERAIREVEYHEARMKELEQK